MPDFYKTPINACAGRIFLLGYLVLSTPEGTKRGVVAKKKQCAIRPFRKGDRQDWQFRNGGMPAIWKQHRQVLHATIRHGEARYDTVISASRTCVLGVAWRRNPENVLVIGLVRQHRFFLPRGEEMRRQWDEALETHRRPALHLLGEETWGLPGGFTESSTLDYGLEAMREVEEELGWRIYPDTLREIGSPPGGTYFEGQHHPIFSMQAMQPAEQVPEAREGSVVTCWVTIAEAKQMIVSGEIRDPLSVTGIALFILLL